MLTRNCAIEKLLNENDFNVRVTIFDASRVSSDTKAQKAAWIEAIRDSLGGGIVNNHASHFQMLLQNENGVNIASVSTAGCNFAKIINALCEKPEPLRITIKDINNKTDRVWIIV